MKRCVFCGGEYSADVMVCGTCNDYKGLAQMSQPATLAVALDSVFALMEQARQAHLENPCDEPDCNCREEVVK